MNLDSRTSELAAKHGANWKTISGAKVLIGKGGKIIAGMGGKFSNLADTKKGANASGGGSFAFTEKSSMGYWLGEEKTKELESIVNASPMSELWTKHANDVPMIGDHKGVGYYDPMSKAIHFHKDKTHDSGQIGNYGTIVHEMSHAIDFKLGFKSEYKTVSYAHKYKDGAFLKAINQDVDQRVRERQSSIKAEFNELKKSGKTPKEITTTLLEKKYIDYKDALKVEANIAKGKMPLVNAKMAQKSIGRELFGQELRVVSDVYGSVTQNNARGGYGHSTAYYRDPENRSAEAFAQMCTATATNKLALAKVKEYLPTAYGVYEEIIADMDKL